MLKLKAKIRKKLERNNVIPGIIYGHKIKNVPIEVRYSDFEKIYQQAEKTTLINLELDNEKRIVLIHDVQTDPITNRYIHIDFYQVRMDEKIKAEVTLNFVGQAPGVVEHGGILVKNMDKLEIEALAKDLPHEIEVDINQLKQIDDYICVKDLNIPKAVEVLDAPEKVVVIIAKPKIQEEEKPAEPVEATISEEEKTKEEETKKDEPENK